MSKKEIDIPVEYLTKEVPLEHLDEDGNDIYAIWREKGLPIMGSGFDSLGGDYICDAPLCHACKYHKVGTEKINDYRKKIVHSCSKLGKKEHDRQSEYPFKYDCNEFEENKDSDVYDLVMEKLKERRK